MWKATGVAAGLLVSGQTYKFDVEVKYKIKNLQTSASVVKTAP